jgi:hypothetical protein
MFGREGSSPMLVLCTAEQAFGNNNDTFKEIQTYQEMFHSNWLLLDCFS